MSVRDTPGLVPPDPATNIHGIHQIRTSLLLSALRYAEHGMYVHPLVVGGKEPRWANWEARATRDPEVIRRTWGRAPFNVGVACGPSGLVAIDLDVPQEGQTAPADFPEAADGTGMLDVLAARTPGAVLPPTMTVRTPSGGRHRIYRAPMGAEVRNSARTVAWCVDVRARGGYVVGIGSVIGGRRYVLEGSVTAPAVLPGWLLTLITTAPEPPKAGGAPRRAEVIARLQELARQGSREQRWAAGILRSECDELAAMAPDSGRNNRLNLAAYRAGQLVAGGLLDQAVAEEALTEAAQACGLGSGGGAYAHEIDKTLRSGMTAGLARPRRMDTAAARRLGGAA
jgi:hypothetical protein